MWQFTLHNIDHQIIQTSIIFNINALNFQKCQHYCQSGTLVSINKSMTFCQSYAIPCRYLKSIINLIVINLLVNPA